ncbi:hypothetical protein [Thiomicrospira sp.]|uniref:hypothetical protein n=1 Tax=Thiomicrospira sp. TaxID=935 RepID=UPI002F927028
MSTVFLYISIAVLIIMIIAKLPGLEHALRPLWDALIKGIAAILSWGVLWVMAVFREAYYAHKVFFFNLFNPRHKVRPEERIEEINKRGGI